MKINIDTSDKHLMSAISILKIFNDEGFDAFLIGGAVRDFCLQLVPKDYDIVTNASIDTIELLFPDSIDIGQNKQMGVIVVKFHDYIFEIAEYRKDQYNNSDGKGASYIERASSLREDCSRRDATINQLAMDQFGNIIDNCNGLLDIKNKVIRAINNPQLRIQEDQIRSMRYIRFASRLNFFIESKTLEAIKNNAKYIFKVSPERIYKELVLMANQPGEKFARAIQLLKDTGLLKYILPKIDCLDKYEQSKIFHPEGNVFLHILMALKENKNSDYILNLSVLLHDIGKSVSHFIKEDGGHAFYGHEKSGIKLINNLCDGLKFPNDLRNTILFTTENHMRFWKIIEMNNNKVLKLIEHKDFEYLKAVSCCDSFCRSEKLKEESIKELRKIEQKIENLKNRYSTNQKIQNVINGQIVMQLRNIDKPSKLIGDIIKDTKEYIVNNNIPLTSTQIIHNFILEWKEK